MAASRAEGYLIATSSSSKNELVGMGAYIRYKVNSINNTISRYSITLGTKDEQNPYTAELAAIAMALKGVPNSLQNQQIVILSRNKGALTAVARPRQQSGQQIIRQVYSQVQRLETCSNRVYMLWVPDHEGFTLGTQAKLEAQKATNNGRIPSTPRWQARSTTTRLAISKQRQGRHLPAEVGHYSKAMDTALPGGHTRALYDQLKRKEAKVLAQLRTGMARLNSYLYRIKAVETDICECGQARETVQHFLFRCTKWNDLRSGMLECTETRQGNLSFFLGGKAPSDQEPWKPDTNAVKTTIRFAISTGRLNTDQEGPGGSQSTNNHNTY